MTIRILPERKGRGYTRGDYEPLSRHYAERVFQVHVINEYARKGLEKIGQALALVLAYFSMDKSAFVARYFPGRETQLERATSQDSYQRIVEDLANPVQQGIVAADEIKNLLVLAGPGSGKTRVVVHRCAYLLRVKRVRPGSVLVLCFNRNAALSLRRRLRELVGQDAQGVRVQTYHGLALRLTGHSLAEAARRSSVIDFDSLLQEAIALLRGKKPLLGLEPDELRDRLLAGYRHILVDEYQDIDEAQYALVSALAGRTLSDPDQRLTILAVGDDDQNIYQFRGANVAFIRRFQQDYQARVCYLLDNYRSSGHIIEAANALIADNQDRMKREQPIRVNPQRAGLAAGGRWEMLDPLAQGRVQILQVADAARQALALVTELERLKRLEPALRWSDCAVFAREWSGLEPVRALCEAEGISISMQAEQDKLSWPLRLREHRRLLDLLHSMEQGLCRADQLLDLQEGLVVDSRPNSWWAQQRRILEAWREESGDAELPVGQALEFVCESLIEQRRELQRMDGVFLSTVHAAKGLEFAHVFVADGGWDRRIDPDRLEEERRLYYVAMTRARETLCLFQLADSRGGFAAGLSGEALFRREGVIDEAIPRDALQRRFAVLGMQELNLGYAGRRRGDDPIHQALSGLEVDDQLAAERRGDKILLLHDGRPVAALARSTTEHWRERLARIESIRVIAMVQRTADDGGEEFRRRCRVAQWEVPLVEVVYR
jgi:ATP-dependent DNA helicase RecQ